MQVFICIFKNIILKTGKAFDSASVVNFITYLLHGSNLQTKILLLNCDIYNELSLSYHAAPLGTASSISCFQMYYLQIIDYYIKTVQSTLLIILQIIFKILILYRYFLYLVVELK